MADTALRLTEESDSIKPIVSAAPTVDQSRFRELLTDEMMSVLSVWNGPAYELLNGSTLSILASGTITMEAAFAGTPMIVGYRTSWLTYWIGSWLVDTDQYAMPNLILSELDVPELIQNDFTAGNIYRTARRFLANRGIRSRQQDKLGRLKNIFESRTPEQAVGRDLLAYLY
jgi:lipid-A-disaccharide synthase